MSVERRLSEFYDFDPEVTHAVAEAAEWQNRLDYQQLANRYELTYGPKRVTAHGLRHSVEYIELTPVGDYDESHVQVMYTPMGIPVDESVAMRAMRMFAANPVAPLCVIGSPSLLGKTSNRVRLLDLPDVKNGRLDGAVSSSVEMLRNRKHVKSIDTLGYSYGADAAATAAAVAGRQGISARAGVWAESASLVKRSPIELLKDFMSSGDQLDTYVAATESEPLKEARKLSRSDIRYFMGLARLSNIAIGVGLAEGDFSGRLKRALANQPKLHAVVAWGTASELTDTVYAREAVLKAQEAHGSHRVSQLPIHNMHHAGGDDIDLHAAIMLQGLRMAQTQRAE